MAVPVYLETGAKRIFAGSIEWPGWARSGRTESDALASLLAYGPRYREVVAASEAAFDAPTVPDQLEVVERLRGDATTDIGAPGQPPSADARPLDEPELKRQLDILRAAWTALDAAAASATGLELRKGPRGGGRELGAILAHVLEAEVAYLHQLGSRFPSREPGADERATVRDTLITVARGLPPRNPTRSGGRWTPRYFVRRAAWHVLDHAWEIEDRAAR
jgi:hypothetical protein